jgi:hypothetical protein
MLAPPWSARILREYPLRPLQDMPDKAAFEAFNHHRECYSHLPDGNELAHLHLMLVAQHTLCLRHHYSIESLEARSTQ